MLKILLLISSCLYSTHAVSIEGYRNIGHNNVIYYQHYLNSKAAFKGTIVFENGSGIDLNEWHKNKSFLKCAKKYGALFFYDHNGLGKSPPDLSLSPNKSLTVKYNTQKLFKLLKQEKIKPPYVLVAHSYGGLFAGYFALRHPGMVKALLLVDPTPRKYTYTQQIKNKFSTVVHAASTQTATKIYHHFSKEYAEVAYLLLGFSKSKQQIESLGTISNKIPVIILSTIEMGKTQSFINENWYTGQKQWLNKNPKSKIIKIHSSHMVPIDNPEAICKQLNALTRS
jgi:pimeloyl-ACP methyl ester carboxylesterase